MVRRYRAKDLLLGIIISLASGIILALVLWMLGSIVYYGSIPILKEGIKALIASPNTSPESPQYGGVGPLIYSTLIIVGTCVLIGLPLGFLTGLYLYEYPTSKLSSIARRLLEVLVEAPTVCYGLVIYLTFVLALKEKLALFAALSLLFIIVPYVAIQTCDILSTLPPELKETCISLGLSRWKTLKVLSRAAWRALIANMMISVAKVLGETGPLLIVAHVTVDISWGPWIYHPLTSIEPVPLTVFIYAAALSALHKIVILGWLACLVLTGMAFGLFIIARVLTRTIEIL